MSFLRQFSVNQNQFPFSDETQYLLHDIKKICFDTGNDVKNRYLVRDYKDPNGPVRTMKFIYCTHDDFENLKEGDFIAERKDVSFIFALDDCTSKQILIKGTDGVDEIFTRFLKERDKVWMIVYILIYLAIQKVTIDKIKNRNKVVNLTLLRIPLILTLYLLNLAYLEVINYLVTKKQKKEWKLKEQKQK